MIDTQTLIACTGATRADAERYTLHLADGMNRFRIHSDSAVAAFLGQLTVESDALQKVEEDLNYKTPDRLREIFPSLFVKGLSRRGLHSQPARTKPASLQGFPWSWPDSVDLGGGLYCSGARRRRRLPWQSGSPPAAAACGVLGVLVFAEYKGCIAPAERGDIYDVTGRVNGPKRLKLAERKAATARAFKMLTA